MKKHSYFTSNIRIIRQRRQLSQNDMAASLGLTRANYKNYENGSVKNPSLDLLARLSEFSSLTIDTLIRVDLEKLSESQWVELEKGSEIYARGSNLRVLVTSVDHTNRENIELVPLKAMAGYTSGYNDPEYISSLPSFQLPFLSSERKYRAFQISGDSMLPVKPGSYVVGEFVEDWHQIRDGHAYIVVTLDEGAVFKVVYNEIRKRKNLLLKSLNPLYKPYEVSVKEVSEVWKFVNYFSSELPDPAMPTDELLEKVIQLKEGLASLEKAVSPREQDANC